MVRLLLWIVPFPKSQQIIIRLAQKRKDYDKPKTSLNKLVWAVKATSPYVYDSTCLINAIAGHILLSRENYSNHLKIGVTKNDQGHFAAHAWLESDDKTVIGESEVEYQTIL